jgi:hypothetical protein
MMAIMSAPYFRERLSGKYISSFTYLRQEWLESLKEITHNNPFWVGGHLPVAS